LLLNKSPMAEDSKNNLLQSEVANPSLNVKIDNTNNKGKAKKMLIVDDNIFNLMAIEQTLQTTFPDLNFDKAYNG
jgi:PleD family two-component response regulator